MSSFEPTNNHQDQDQREVATFDFKHYTGVTLFENNNNSNNSNNNTNTKSNSNNNNSTSTTTTSNNNNEVNGSEPEITTTTLEKSNKCKTWFKEYYRRLDNYHQQRQQRQLELNEELNKNSNGNNVSNSPPPSKEEKKLIESEHYQKETTYLRLMRKTIQQEFEPLFLYTSYQLSQGAFISSSSPKNGRNSKAYRKSGTFHANSANSPTSPDNIDFKFKSSASPLSLNNNSSSPNTPGNDINNNNNVYNNKILETPTTPMTFKKDGFTLGGTISFPSPNNSHEDLGNLTSNNNGGKVVRFSSDTDSIPSSPPSLEMDFDRSNVRRTKSISSINKDKGGLRNFTPHPIKNKSFTMMFKLDPKAQLEKTEKLLQEKEEDTRVAAEIGQTLLERNDELEREIKGLHAKQQELNEKLSQMNAIQSDNDKLQTEIIMLKSKVDSAANENETLWEKENQLSEQLRDRSQWLKNEYTPLKARTIEQQKEEIESLKMSVDQLHASQSKLSKNRDRLITQNQNLYSSVQDLQHMLAEKIDQSEYDLLVNKVKNLRVKNKELQMVIKEIQEKGSNSLSLVEQPEVLIQSAFQELLKNQELMNDTPQIANLRVVSDAKILLSRLETDVSKSSECSLISTLVKYLEEESLMDFNQQQQQQQLNQSLIDSFDSNTNEKPVDPKAALYMLICIVSIHKYTKYDKKRLEGDNVEIEELSNKLETYKKVITNLEFNLDEAKMLNQKLEQDIDLLKTPQPTYMSMADELKMSNSIDQDLPPSIGGEQQIETLESIKKSYEDQIMELNQQQLSNSLQIESLNLQLEKLMEQQNLDKSTILDLELSNQQSTIQYNNLLEKQKNGEFKLNQLQQDNESIQLELELIKQEKEKIQSESNQSKQEIDSIQLKVQQLNDNNSTLELKLQQSLEDNSKLKLELDQIKLINSKLELDLQQSKENNEKVQSELESSRKDNEKTQLELNQSKDNNEKLQLELEKSRKEFEQLQLELQQSRKDNEKIILESNQLKQDNEKIQLELQQSRKDTEKIQLELQDMTKIKIELQETNNKIQQDNEKIQLELQQSQKDNELVQLELQERLQQHIDQLDESTQQVSELSKMDLQQKEIVFFMQYKYKGIAEKLRVKLEGVKDRLGVFEVQANINQKEMDRLKQELQDETSKSKKLSLELDQAKNNNHADLNQLNQQLSDRQIELDELSDKYQQLQQQYQQSQLTNSQQLDNYKSLLTKLDGEMEKLQLKSSNELDQLLNRLVAMQEKLNQQVISKQSEQESIVQEMKKEITYLNDKIDQLVNEVQNEKENNDALTTEKSQLEDSIKDLQSKLENKTRKHQAVKELSQQLTDMIQLVQKKKQIEEQQELDKIAAAIQRPTKEKDYEIPEEDIIIRYINEKVEPKEYINHVFPIDPANHILLSIYDGVLLCELVNFAKEGTIDERVMNTKPQNQIEIDQNFNLFTNSARAIGCKMPQSNISPQILRQDPKLPISMIYELISVSLLSKININNYPNLLMLKQADEDIKHFLALSNQQLLKRWLLHHLEIKKSKSTLEELALDPKNLIKLLCKLDKDLVYDQGSQDLDQELNWILNQSYNNFNIFPWLDLTTLKNGNQKLILLYLASIFLSPKGGLTITTNGTEVEKVKEQNEVLSKAVQEAKDFLHVEMDGTREERAFCMWINSLNINTYVNNLQQDLQDGLVILQVLDKIKNGCVNWKSVNMHPSNTYMEMENCNYGISIAKKLKFSLVGIDGKNIHDGNRKLTLALIWQACKYHLLSILQTLRGEGGKEVTEADIIRWANQKVTTIGKSSGINNFKDPSIGSGLFLIDLLESVSRGAVNYSIVHQGDNDDEKKSNAQLIINVARKLDCCIFLVWEDIVQVRPKMILTLVAQLYIKSEGL